MIKTITIILFLASSLTANAQTITLDFNERTKVNAIYETGDADKPLLILLHGFLQTNEFSTVKRLYDSLSELEFSVLSPNLSLGISDRAQSLVCESIHLHSLDSDVAEVAFWVDWAIKQGHKEIVLIGHSAGSSILTKYLAEKAHLEIKKSILISLTPFGPNRPGAFETVELKQKAMSMLENNDNSLSEFALSYCKKYITTPDRFINYYDWSRQKTLKAINSHGSENYVIVGSKDNRMSSQWVESMKKASANIIVVDGASHFFDQSHEFDLLDTIESLIVDD